MSDYFAAANLLYEHVPQLGHANCWLKRSMG